jgi:hypothetical protein
LGFGEALAKEQVHSNPVTEPKRSQNPKRPLPALSQPNGYSIYENALSKTPSIGRLFFKLFSTTYAEQIQLPFGNFKALLFGPAIS